MLSRKTRATASVFSCSTAVRFVPAASRVARWKAARNEGGEAARLLLELAHRFKKSDALLSPAPRCAGAEDHRRNWPHSQARAPRHVIQRLVEAARWPRDAIPEAGCAEARRVVADNRILSPASPRRAIVWRMSSPLSAASAVQSPTVRGPRSRAKGSAGRISRKTPSSHSIPQAFNWESSAPTPLTRRTPVLPRSTGLGDLVKQAVRASDGRLIPLDCAAVHHPPHSRCRTRWRS